MDALFESNQRSRYVQIVIVIKFGKAASPSGRAAASGREEEVLLCL